MKKVMTVWAITALGIFCGFITACKNEDTPNLPGGKGNILLQTTIKNTDGMSGQSYIQLIPSIGTSPNIAEGIQVGFASAITVEGEDIFVFPEFGHNGIQSILKYKHHANSIQKVGEMQITPNSFPNNMTKVSEQKAYIPMYTLGKIMIINPEKMQKSGEIDLSEYAHKDQSAEPSYGIVRDGIYYLPLDQIGNNWMPYEDYRQVDVALIDTKTDKVVKVISEKSSGLCFPTRPFLRGMIFTNEQQDIFIACTGYFGYNPQYVKNGFVCIPAGSQAFDESRTWDISNTPIQGSKYKAATIYNCKYIGEGKVAAYVGVLELMGNNPYTARNSMAVIIDLKNKTIKKIDGIPYTDGHSVAIEYHQNEVFFSSYGMDKSGIFSYNIHTGTVSQALNSKGNISFMHFFK